MTAWSRPCTVCARLQRWGQKGAVRRFVSAPPTVAAVIWSAIKWGKKYTAGPPPLSWPCLAECASHYGNEAARAYSPFSPDL